MIGPTRLGAGNDDTPEKGLPVKLIVCRARPTGSMLRFLRADTSGTIANTMRRRRQKRGHGFAAFCMKTSVRRRLPTTLWEGGDRHGRGARPRGAYAKRLPGLGAKAVPSRPLGRSIRRGTLAKSTKFAAVAVTG